MIDAASAAAVAAEPSVAGIDAVRDDTPAVPADPVAADSSANASADSSSSAVPAVPKHTGATAAGVAVGLLQRELGRARQKIASLDRVDVATGLLKLGYFEETLRRDLAVARREQRPVAVIVFEIMDFEAYRRTFGDKAAESCLRMIGAQVTRVLRRAGDLCARYDDSTVVASVLGQSTEEAQRLAGMVVEHVRKLGLHNPRARVGRYVAVRSAVFGCTPADGDEPATMIGRAREQLPAVEADARSSGAQSKRKS